MPFSPHQWARSSSRCHWESAIFSPSKTEMLPRPQLVTTANPPVPQVDSNQSSCARAAPSRLMGDPSSLSFGWKDLGSPVVHRGNSFTCTVLHMHLSAWPWEAS